MPKAVPYREGPATAATRAAQKITAGDTVWIEPGEEHWHGAMPAHAMIHIAIQESLDGTMANWLNKLSDEEYQQSVATL